MARCYGRNMLNHDVPYAVVHADRYAIGGLIYIFTSQDLSLLGYPQSVIMQQLLLYWLSDAVQSNMSSMGASPLVASEVSAPVLWPNCSSPQDHASETPWQVETSFGMLEDT